MGGPTKLRALIKQSKKIKRLSLRTFGALQLEKVGPFFKSGRRRLC
jgi:hypothetical protein